MESLGRRILGVVAASLCLAAVAAIFAILSGDFGDDEWRVIASSVLVAVASSTAGAGMGLRLNATGPAVALGNVVVAASALAFVLVNVGMWGDIDGEPFWRTAAVAAIVAVDGAHACLVLARRRWDDTAGTELATQTAVAGAAISGTFGVLAATGVAEDGPWQLLAVVLVIQVLASVMAPILRRMAGERPAAAATPPVADLARELDSIATALERADSLAEVEVLAQRLRRLAR